jgi:hypothetical protein
MPENLGLFSGYLEFMLNMLQLTAIAVSGITFFFLMFNKFSNGLKAILAPCGFNAKARLKAFFVCRQSLVKKRAFLEYAMLKSQGYVLISSEWNSIINEFKVFYDDNKANLSYSIPNCTVLIGEDFSIVVRRYFEYFSIPKVKKAFGISDDRIGWILNIHIEEAYATPTCLLTGLLSRFEENWGEFIKRYISTAYIAGDVNNNYNAILSDELYLTFAWLLWGPSYELKYKKYWRGLCQISYGDESNSIPVVINADTNAISVIKEKFAANEGQQYGALLSIDVSLYENKAFYKSIRNTINYENAYFYDKIEKSSISFAAQVDKLTLFDNYKANRYYCTAYVWLLFELDDEAFYSFSPENSLAFFEHANLTDKETYLFLIETLIDKSIKHFTKIFGKPDLEGRKYRFVCAMNEEITTAFLKRYKEIMDSGSEIGKAFTNRILLEPKHSPAAAFAAYDKYFSTESLISFVEVTLKNKDTVSEFAMFYTDIYMENFPDPDERETFDNFLVYLKNAQTADKYMYHIILAKDNNKNIIGGGIFNYFKRPNAGVIEFIAVKNNSQSGGTGTMIFNHILEIMSADAFRMQKKKLEYVFCEIDSPEYSKASIKKYLHFWTKHHFWRLDFSYVQPSLSQSQSPVTGLWFTVSPLAGKSSEIQGELVVNVLSDYMKYAMQIDNPDENPDFQKMRDEIMSKKIHLLPIM